MLINIWAHIYKHFYMRYPLYLFEVKYEDIVMSPLLIHDHLDPSILIPLLTYNLISKQRELVHTIHNPFT